MTDDSELPDVFHVLVAIDGNEERLSRLLEAVEQLPGREDIQSTVLYVHEEVDTPADEAGKQVIDAINEDIDDLQGLPDSLERARDALTDLGIETTVSTAKGSPAAAILDVADDCGADAIYLAGRKRTPVGKAVFGSVTQSVILDSELPVTVA